MSVRSQSIVIYVVLVIMIIGMLALGFELGKETSPEIDFNQLKSEIDSGKVQEVIFSINQIEVVHKDQSIAHMPIVEGDQLTLAVIQYVSVATEPPKLRFLTPWYANLLPYLISSVIAVLLTLLVIYLWELFARRGLLQLSTSTSKSRVRKYMVDHQLLEFSEIGGLAQAKEVVTEVVYFLKEPQKFLLLGARPPKGLLIYGPSGCGKTMLAKAMVGAGGVPAFEISAPEFIETTLGVGPARVRDLFDQGKRDSPCFIIIDHIDALGSRDVLMQQISHATEASKDLAPNQSERIQTIDQLLDQLDGFDTDSNVIVVMITDKMENVDPNLLRPGRVDRYVKVDLPDKEDRKAILRVHMKGKPVDPTVNIDMLADMSEGFSGAAIENCVNEGAIVAARRNRKSIVLDDFIDAFLQHKGEAKQLAQK